MTVTHVEETCTEVDTRHVGRDVIDELSIGDVDASLAAEDHRLAVDRRDEGTASEDSSTGRAHEELVDGEGGDELHDPEGDRETDSLADIR